MQKLISAIRGAGIAAGNIQLFDTSIFGGKRIAIVGPAQSAFNTSKGGYIDGHDLVIRMNKSPRLVADGEHAQDIGTRTDILFHCFHENAVGGGGPIDFPLYKRQGITHVVNPRFEWSGLRNSYNFYKKYCIPEPTYLLPRTLYKDISRSVGPHRPTTGYSALYSVMRSRFSQLFITGFTFFKTAYGSGYRDEMREAHQAQQFIKSVGLHNPDSELAGFCRLLKSNPEADIVMDDELNRIVELYA